MIPGIVAGQMRAGSAPGGDPHWANVVSLAHFDSDFVDAKDAVVWTKTGSVVIQSDAAAFGGAGAYNPGNSTWLERAIPALGTQDFTLEFRVKPTTLTQVTKRLLDLRTAGVTGTGLTLSLSSAGTLSLAVNGATTSSSTVGGLTAMTALCVERSGDIFTVYVDGVSVLSTTATGALPYTTLRMMNSIANSAQWTTQGTQGVLDELRLTVGVARYQGNYTPATSAFPNA